MNRRPFFTAFAASALAVALLGCTAEPDPSPAAPKPTSQPAPSPSAEAPADDGSPRTIAAGLAAPWSIAFFGDTPLVSERDTARIVELDEQGTVREVAVIAGVAPGGEGGLLGIAVHDEHLYAYFTAAGENRIERFTIEGRAGGLSLGAPQAVLSGIPSAAHHNGGRIAFGPDGMLYATAGDASETDNAQSLDSLAGKILRIAPDGSVPPDNPFAGSYVYSYGHRNPQGIGWGPDGTMYASEFGQDTWDELNVITAGANYGWPLVEGAAGIAGYTDPVQQWATPDASPSGIAVSDDSIFIANLRGQRLREVPLHDLGGAIEHFVGDLGRIRDAVVAPDGSIWVLTNNTDGRGSPGPEDDRIVRFRPE